MSEIVIYLAEARALRADAESRQRKAGARTQPEMDPGQAETLRILDRIIHKLGLEPDKE